MKETPPIMTLNADFDIAQIGETLEFSFTRTDGQGNPIEGKDAGSVYFTKGEQFNVVVNGGGRVKSTGNPFEDFKILDCCLITIPRLAQFGEGIKTQFSPPSPFVSAKTGAPFPATINLDASKFKEHGRGAAGEGRYHKVKQVWGEHLVTGTTTGRWKLSFVITVAIRMHDGSIDTRVLSFDPEVVVGTGMNPPQ